MTLHDLLHSLSRAHRLCGLDYFTTDQSFIDSSVMAVLQQHFPELNGIVTTIRSFDCNKSCGFSGGCNMVVRSTSIASFSNDKVFHGDNDAKIVNKLIDHGVAGFRQNSPSDYNQNISNNSLLYL